MNMLATRAIPSVTPEKWRDVAEDARSVKLPLLIHELFAAQARAWSPERFVEHWPTREVAVVVDLPPHGVPYREQSDNYHRRLTMREFVALLREGRAAYLNQAALADYDALRDDIPADALGLGRIFALNLWVGGRTRSGLHYDNADNLFGQIFGTKRALLISPEYSRRLYPFADNPSKSQVDLDDPDERRFPKIARVEVWSCDLQPGDALYIPRGWWHHITAADVSISINCWHGDTLSEYERLQGFLAGGTRVLSRTVYDFVWHGVCGRPYRARLFSPPPPGVRAYRSVKARFH
jgi:hypothetical protein